MKIYVTCYCGVKIGFLEKDVKKELIHKKGKLIVGNAIVDTDFKFRFFTSDLRKDTSADVHARKDLYLKFITCPLCGEKKPLATDWQRFGRYSEESEFFILKNKRVGDWEKMGG